MTEADVNLSSRLDGVGVIVQQKRLLDRVSAVLCDGLGGALGDDPPTWWRGCAEYAAESNLRALSERCEAISDLIEQENL